MFERFTLDSQVRYLQSQLVELEEICSIVISSLPEFEIAGEEALPLGLKPHTRSVSWIVEQVINQRFYRLQNELGISNLDIEVPDTALHDLSFTRSGETFYVNIKTHQSGNKPNKNDISAVEKLYKAYLNDPDYNLYYAAFGIQINQLERMIRFESSDLLVFSPQFMPLYVNPRNDKLQAFYRHTPEIRSREAFLTGLVEKSGSIQL